MSYTPLVAGTQISDFPDSWQFFVNKCAVRQTIYIPVPMHPAFLSKEKYGLVGQRVNM